MFTKRTYRRARGLCFKCGELPCMRSMYPRLRLLCSWSRFFSSLRQKERKRRGRKDHTQYESKHKPNENRCSEKEGTVLPFWSQGSLWPICQYVVHSLTSKIAYNGWHVPAISEKVEGPFRDSKSCLVLNSACKERSR